MNIRKRAVDGIIPLPKREAVKVFRRLGNILRLGAHGTRIVFASLFSLSLVAGSSLLISGFEAHVINVTAKIEQPPMCDARSKGYWRNHEGCTNGGNGSSVWTSQINALSASSFSGAFAAFTGPQICDKLWIPNCPSGNTWASKLCKAQGPTLADELNVVSNRLDLNAILAGADDGTMPFDNLGLDSNSTIRQALAIIEAIIADAAATKTQLKDAAHIAERIYTFYEGENPNKPFCVYSLSTTLSVSSSLNIDTEENSRPQDNSDETPLLDMGSSTGSSTPPEIEIESTVLGITEATSTELVDSSTPPAPEDSELVEGETQPPPPTEPPPGDPEPVEESLPPPPPTKTETPSE